MLADNPPRPEQRQGAVPAAAASAEAQLGEAAAPLLQGRSLCLFGAANPVRVAAAWLVTHRHFDNLVLVLILASSVALAIDTPGLNPDGGLKRALQTLDVVFAVLFAVEAALKVLAAGLLLCGPGSYLKSAWNVLDLLVVLVGITSVAIAQSGGNSQNGIAGLRALRTLRALRPLRAASRLPGMRVVIDALFGSLPAVGNVLLVCLLFFTVFGIMAINLLAGALHSCRSSDDSVYDAAYVLPPGQAITRDWCLQPGLLVDTSAYHAAINVSLPAYTPDRRWVNRLSSFDNIALAVWTLFQTSTTEGWMDVTFAAIDAVGIDQQPVMNANPAMAVFFVIFMVFGAYFVLQLFVSVTVEKFSEMQEQAGGALLLTPTQQQWLSIQKLLAATRPQVRLVAPDGRLRGATFRLVTSDVFEAGVLALVVANVALLAATSADSSAAVVDAMGWANTAFTAAFTCEAALKLLALGPRQYLRDRWCLFDLLVLAASIAGTATDLATTASLSVLPLLRVLRVLRALRVIPRARGLRTLLSALLYSIPALSNVCGVLLLFFFIYAVTGMNLFGGLRPGQQLDNRHAGFVDMPMALITLFRMTTGEAWQQLMWDCMVSSQCVLVTQDVQLPGASLAAGTYLDPGDPQLAAIPPGAQDNQCSPSPAAAIAYYCSFVLLCGLIMTNFVIGVIIDSMQGSAGSSSDDLAVRHDHLLRFVEVWSELDPGGSGLIPAVQLSLLISELDPPLGLRGEPGGRPRVQALIMGLDIPVRPGSKVHFWETLHALAGTVAGAELPQEAEEQLHREMAARLTIPATVAQTAPSAIAEFKGRDGVSPAASVPKYTVAHFYAALYVQAAVRGFLRRHAVAVAAAAAQHDDDRWQQPQQQSDHGKL